VTGCWGPGSDVGRAPVPARGPLDRGLEPSRRRAVCRALVAVVGWVDVVAVVASAVCCGDHPRATPAGERRRSWLDVGGREWSVDAGDGGEDGEDKDGRGGGRRKRTQNVMGNIRNYDIDQLDAQPKTDVIPVSRSFYFLFHFSGHLSFRTDKRKGGERMETDAKILARTRHSRCCARRFASCFRGGTRPIGRGAGVTNPRDIGSFATASRSSVNTLAVVPELTRKKENKAENKEMLPLVLARRPFRGYAC